VRNLILILALAILAACSSSDLPMQDLGAGPSGKREILPPMKFFGEQPVTPAQRANREISRDFMDLTFHTEKDSRIPVLTRFEGPISLRVTGHVPGTLDRDLTRLLNRLRKEARISISRVAPSQQANITIEIVPRVQFRSLSTQAACFVVPQVGGWAEYKRKRRTSAVKWANLRHREKLAIFIPGGISPQEMRDCLHEELAQALGPLNDLYRLPDSVYNDDNFHSVLTGFDMLILRAYYAPELHNGMTEAQVAARLPALLARLNPAGQRRSAKPGFPDTPRLWIKQIQTALSPGKYISRSARRNAAASAVILARQNGLYDMRLGFSLYAFGRLSLADDPNAALAAFQEAVNIFRSQPQTEIAIAHIAWQQATIALSDGDALTTIDLVNANLPAAKRGQNAALLATLLMLKAAALDMVQRPSEARAVRLDSLGWARYGFGSDKEVRRQLQDVSALALRAKNRGTP